MSRRYTPEFKAQVVRALLDEYRSTKEVSATFNVPSGTFGGWLADERNLRRYKADQARAELVRAEAVLPPTSENSSEVIMLRRERDRLLAYVQRQERVFEQIQDLILDLTNPAE